MNEVLSGTAMRTFLRIAKEWGLSEPETRAVLGKPTRLTLMTWSHDARRRKHLRLPPEVLKRITLVIQTHLVLRGIDQSEWIRAGHPSLYGLTPIKLLTDTTDRVAIARDAALIIYRRDKRCS